MKHRFRVVLAGAIGNLLEWYDFGLYGLLAPVLASLFFPSQDRMASLLGAYGGFAIGFAARPLGALVLGRLADRVGRKFVLTLSITLMGLATVMVGLLPTYSAVGIWAPVLLIGARIFQGFSVGGEFVDSVTYLVETVPPRRRGIAGSIANVGSTGGMLLGAGVSAAMAGWAGPHLAAWGWRIPFLLGGVIACAGLYFRRHLPESMPPADPADKGLESPLRQAFREQPRIIVASVLFASGYGIANYLIMVFLPTFAHEFSHLREQQVLSINTAGQALALFVVPLSGWLSDRWIRRRTLLALAFLGQAIVAWEAFTLVAAKGAQGLWVAQLTLAILLALVMGAAPAMLSEQFRPAYRVSAHAVVFNVGIGFAGGTAPIFATALIKAVSSPMAAAGYLIFGSLLSTASVLALLEHSRKPLG